MISPPPPTDHMISFNRAHRTGRELALLDEVMNARWSGDGPMTKRAATLLQGHLGGGSVLLTTSCTHALEMAAMLLDIQPGDEVIVPSFTFVSTASAFALRGAKLVFVDARPDTLNLDERLLAEAVTPRTKVIVPVHYAGVACQMDVIGEIAASAGAAVVEDNAHGLFGTWRGKPLGSLGVLAAQSFHETKNISCGEGGALVINDRSLQERAEIIREKGTNRTKFFRGEVDKYGWVDLGSSYLPSDLLAAVLVAQLETAAQTQASRVRIWETYMRELAPWAEKLGVTLPTVPADCTHPAHLFYMLLPSLETRSAFLAHMVGRRVQAIFHYQSLHTSPYGGRYGFGRGTMPVTERAADVLVRLPLYADLTDGELARVVDAVMSFSA